MKPRPSVVLVRFAPLVSRPARKAAAAIALWTGASFLGLFMQINWTGPGVDEEELADAEDKGELIELIVAKLAAVEGRSAGRRREELSQQRVRELRVLAAQAGAAETGVGRSGSNRTGIPGVTAAPM
jgi:hypothetical protein